MLYAVVEWSLAGTDTEAKLLELLGPVDAKDGSESAAIRAKELTSKFDHSDLDEDTQYPYYCGRNDGATSASFRDKAGNAYLFREAGAVTFPVTCSAVGFRLSPAAFARHPRFPMPRQTNPRPDPA